MNAAPPHWPFRDSALPQVHDIMFQHWRESQGNGGGASLDSVGDRRRSSSAALSDVPTPTGKTFTYFEYNVLCVHCSPNLKFIRQIPISGTAVTRKNVKHILIKKVNSPPLQILGN